MDAQAFLTPIGTVLGAAISAWATLRIMRGKKDAEQSALRKELQSMYMDKIRSLEERGANLLERNRILRGELNTCERERLLLHTEVGRLKALRGK